MSQASATASEWDSHSNNGDRRSIFSGVSSGDRMTTISESSRTKSNDDGVKVGTPASGLVRCGC